MIAAKTPYGKPYSLFPIPYSPLSPVSPGPPRPGRSAALDLAEWWIGGWADRASLCSQPVDPGCLSRNFLTMGTCIEQTSDC